MTLLLYHLKIVAKSDCQVWVRGSSARREYVFDRAVIYSYSIAALKKLLKEKLELGTSQIIAPPSMLIKAMGGQVRDHICMCPVLCGRIWPRQHLAYI